MIKPRVLPAVLLVWSVSFAAQAQDDPHAGVAPGVGSCTPCHTCAQPTPEAPCLRVCARGLETQDPAGNAGELAVPGAPDVVVLAHLEDLYEAVRFDHRGHAEMAAMSDGCTVCHHRTPEGMDHPACRTCHDTASARENLRMPGLKGAYHRQCMSCHQEWTHDTACGACHAPKVRGLLAESDPSAARAAPASLSRALVEARATFVYDTPQDPWPVVTFHHLDHVESFGLNCIDCHRETSCNQCHDPAAPHREMNHLETCGSCHADQNCAFCHDDSERPSFDHATSTGWSLEPYHTGVSCVDCHGDDRHTAPPSRTCHACHVLPSVAGFDHQVVAADYGARPNELGCLSCHTDIKACFDDATVVHGPARGPAGCTGCHGPLDALSSSVPPEGRKQLCLGCHDKPIDTRDGRTIQDIGALLTSSADQHGPIRQGDCCACHQPHASAHACLLVDEYPPGFYAPFEVDRYKLCFRCHEEDRVLSESGRELTGFRNGDRNLHWLHVNRKKGRTCRACHEVHASSQPFHIRDAVPFGDGQWMLELGYERTPKGGTCTPACHVEQSYDREAERPIASGIAPDGHENTRAMDRIGNRSSL